MVMKTGLVGETAMVTKKESRTWVEQLTTVIDSWRNGLLVDGVGIWVWVWRSATEQCTNKGNKKQGKLCG